MDGQQSLNSVPAVARRLQGIRLALGLSQAEFTRRAGIGYTVWNNYERGEALISITSARRLRSRFGISLDYIYEGDCSQLPQRLVNKLDEYGLRSNAAS